MEYIIFKKRQRAHVVKTIAIILSVLCVSGIIIYFLGVHVVGLIALFLFFAAITLWIVYSERYGQLEKSMKMIHGNIRPYLEGVHEGMLLQRSGIYCGEHALVVKGSGVIIPYAEILWIYQRTVTAYYVVSLGTDVVICTTGGEQFLVHFHEQDLLWFLENYRHKFLPQIIVGYGNLQIRTYNQYIKQRKAQKHGSSADIVLHHGRIYFKGGEAQNTVTYVAKKNIVVYKTQTSCGHVSVKTVQVPRGIKTEGALREYMKKQYPMWFY